MPRSKTNTKRTKPIAADIIAAAEAVLQNRLSLRQASTDFQVKRSTLSRHLQKHRQSGAEFFVYGAAQDVKLVFTKNQELELVKYLIVCSQMHYGLSTVEVQKLAFDYAKANNLNCPPSWETKQKAGKEWFRYFLRRHPNISLRKPQATSLARSTAFNKANVNTFYDKLEELMIRYKFAPQNIFNLDETGISTVHTPVRVIATRGSKQVGSMTSAERGINVTMICCINALGNSIPPLFVFPRVFFKEHMLKGAPIGSIGSANPSGWSNAAIFVKYLNHFINHTRTSIENRTLLIIDNHESHISIEALNLAKNSGVAMLTFPPHTSHKLQPLDRALYGPLKKYYNTACTEWLLSNAGKTMTIYDVAECAGKAYPQAFTVKNVQSGFSVSGIYPLNRNSFEEHEFLSSYVSDRPMITPTQVINEPSTSQLIGDARQPSTFKTCVSPEQIRPFPKAEARKATRKGGRKPGRCRIITDSPEKHEFEVLAEIKKNRSRKVSKQCNQVIKKQGIKRKLCKTGLKEDAIIEDYEVTSDDSIDDVGFASDNVEGIEIDEDPSIEDYILVKIETKKLRKFYVAHIIELGYDSLTVKYLRKSRYSMNFLSDNDTVYELAREDIVMKLGKPQIVGGTARKCEELKFSVDMSSYNVE